MPVAAMVTTREIYQRAVGTLERSYVHQSTYGRNRLSMAAGPGHAADHRARRAGRARCAQVGRRAARRARPSCSERYEMIREVRGRGLMIGIELGAPRSRVARLNWRLIHMASEGLFPQLIVIPLHRDHGVITMAAGKNDVIKLLPPLTLSEAEAQTFSSALDAVLADCDGAGEQELGGRARHRDGDAAPRPGASPATPSDRAGAVAPGTAVDAARGDVCLVTGATGFIGGRLAQRLVGGGLPGALPGAREQRHLAAGAARRRARGRRPDERRARSRAPSTGCRYVFHCGALRVRLGDRARRSRAPTSRARATCWAASARRSVERVDPLQHHRRLRLSRARRRRGDPRGHAVSQLVRADQARRRGRGPPRRAGARARRRDPAPGHGLRPRLDRGRRRDRARDARRQHGARRPRSSGRGPVLRREPRRRGDARAARTRTRPGRRSTSATAST